MRVAYNSRSQHSNRGSYGRDAASGSPYAFLQSELEFVQTDLVKPMYAETHARDITMTFGGGFVDFVSAFASDYGTTGSNQYGLQGTNNTDIPQVKANITKGLWKSWNWAASSVISHLDLEKLQTAKRLGQPAPFSLQALIEDGVRIVWSKALEAVVYNGWLGQPGLVNNTAVSSSLAPATGAGGLRTWASKTPLQIQADINFGIVQPLEGSSFSLEGMPDTLLVDWDIYSLLTQPYVLGTVGGYASIMEYVMANNIARKSGIDFKILPIANPWINTQGAGGSNRGVFYRNAPQSVNIQIPAPMSPIMTVPSVKDGVVYETAWMGNIGQVQFKRSQTFYYLDGI